jgi:diguanylate cyclase (GGDEF)-like protein
MPQQLTISHVAELHRGHPRGLSTITQTIVGWSEVAAGLMRSTLDGLGTTRRGDGTLHEFADFLAKADDPAAIQGALVRLAHRLSGAAWVELFRDETPGRTPERVAVWPLPEGHAPPEPAGDLGVTLRLGVELHGQRWGALHFVAERRRWPAPLVRRLTTLATMAAAAERAAKASRTARLPSPFDSATGLYNEPFLKALLEHALRQARRRNEPLTLICLGIGPAEATAQLPRPRLTDAVMQVVARAVVSTLRTSDILARLDDGCLAAILPGAAFEHYPTVAEALRRAITEAALITATPGPLAISLGFACHPGDGETAESLLAAGFQSLEQARAEACLAALGPDAGLAAGKPSRSEPRPT